MDVVTLGESMVLLTPTRTGPLRYAHTFNRQLGGAESNVAIGLARLGKEVGWISKVGADEFGEYVISTVRGEGVDTTSVKRDSQAPTGLYIKELRTTDRFRVFYYRHDSAASRLTPSDLDESYISQAKVLHLTGITPALSESCKETVEHAFEIARRHNQIVSFDPNIRLKLWTVDEASSVLRHFISKSDIVLPGLDEGELLYNEADPERLAEKILDTGPGVCVVKLGAKGAYFATKDGEKGFVPGLKFKQIVDPVGAGDGFAAGFLCGYLEGQSWYDAVKMGNKVGGIVTQFAGDMEGLPTQEDLAALETEQEDVSR